jgi:hypothetical protein
LVVPRSMPMMWDSDFMDHPLTRLDSTALIGERPWPPADRHGGFLGTPAEDYQDKKTAGKGSPQGILRGACRGLGGDKKWIFSKVASHNLELPREAKPTQRWEVSNQESQPTFVPQPLLTTGMSFLGLPARSKSSQITPV